MVLSSSSYRKRLGRGDVLRPRTSKLLASAGAAASESALPGQNTRMFLAALLKIGNTHGF